MRASMSRAKRVAATAFVLSLCLGDAVPALAQSASPSPRPNVTFTAGVTGDLNSANPFRQLDTTESMVGG